jgi:hypothetical protein
MLDWIAPLSLFCARVDLSNQEWRVMLFAYIGPDTMLPLASVVTGIVGVALMFGRQVKLAVRNLVRRVTGRSEGK